MNISKATSNAASMALKSLCDRYWDNLCSEQPLAAIMAGHPTQETVLFRTSIADHRQAAVSAKGFLAQLQAIPFAGLQQQDRQTWRLLEHDLKLALRSFETQDHLRPMIYPFGIESNINYIGDISSFTCVADAELYIRRLLSVPEGIKGALECLEAGQRAGFSCPKLIIERAAATVRALLARPLEQTSLMRPFVQSSLQSDEMKALRAKAEAVVTGVINPAIVAYVDFIEKKLGAHARDTLGCTAVPQGDEHYKMLIERYTTECASPEEIHAFGLSEVARITGQMQQIATEAGFNGDLAAYRTALLAKPGQILPSAEALLEKIEVLSKRIDGRMPEFFGRLPRMTYAVRSIPASLAVLMPPAYAQPNPADCTTAGVHWITSLPERCPSYMHIPLALHEAWPGHLMHLALMQEMELPAFRRYNSTRYSAQLEGWALYCESLGYELGLYDTPDKKYGSLEMEIWRACRLVVDTGLHVKNWSRDQAIEFMTGNMSLPLDTIRAEVDRYIGMPAQALGYQLGFRCVRNLRADAQARLGNGFRVRDFHDALMEVGAVTLPVWREAMNDWVESRVALASRAA